MDLQGSIRKKLTSITLVTSGTSLVLACTIFFVIEYASFRNSLKNVLEAQATNIADNMSAALVFDNPSSAGEIVRKLAVSHDIIHADIFGSDNNLFASYTRAGEKPGDHHFQGTDTPPEITLTSITLASPVLHDGNRIGTVVLTASLSQLYLRLALDVAILAGVFSASLLASFILIKRLQRKITTPLYDVVEVMTSVSRDGNYSLRAAVTTDDEIGFLAGRFNMMLAEVEAREHELRLHRHNLEEQVRWRTAELEQASRELQQELAERRKAEEKLQRYAEELREANEEVKSFTYIVSHDLRAPLVNIKGFATELQENVKLLAPVIESGLPLVEAGLQTQARETVETDIPECMSFIGSSISRMENMIASILNLSRIGRRDLTPEQVDLDELVRRIVASMQHQVDSGNVAVTIDPLPPVYVDRTAIEQIFGNLIDNALKYLRKDTPGTLHVSCREKADEVEFSVRDNGRGIPAGESQKVFEIFHRAGRRDVPGEGLGLAYVKTLVRRHEGRIWCESTEGEGTSFFFTLPTLAPAADSPAA